MAALSRLDIDLSVWRIHRRIGMSGGLFVSALVRETGVELSEADVAMLQQAHAEGYLAQADTVRALPGAAGLLARAHRARRPLGHRHQQLPAHLGARARPARAAGGHAHDHP